MRAALMAEALASVHAAPLPLRERKRLQWVIAQVFFGDQVHDQAQSATGPSEAIEEVAAVLDAARRQLVRALGIGSVIHELQQRGHKGLADRVRAASRARNSAAHPLPLAGLAGEVGFVLSSCGEASNRDANRSSEETEDDPRDDGSGHEKSGPQCALPVDAAAPAPVSVQTQAPVSPTAMAGATFKQRGGARDLPVQRQRPVPMAQTVQESATAPRVQCVDQSATPHVAPERRNLNPNQNQNETVEPFVEYAQGTKLLVVTCEHSIENKVVCTTRSGDELAVLEVPTGQEPFGPWLRAAADEVATRSGCKLRLVKSNGEFVFLASPTSPKFAQQIRHHPIK